MMTDLFDTPAPANDASPYPVGTALDLPSGGRGYIVEVTPCEAGTYTLGAFMRADLWAIRYASETHVGTASEHVVAPMVERARNVPGISEAEAAALLARATEAMGARRARTRQEEAARDLDRADSWEQVQARRPDWAKSAIIAEYQVDQSDSMTDYFASSTTRTVVLAWSAHNRDLFPEMRKAAATFAETAHLATAPASAEHREKYSMGGGYYLKDSYRHSTGWRVRKQQVDWLKGTIVEFPEVLTSEEVAAVSEQAASAAPAGRFTLEQHHNERRGFDYWLAILSERVERDEYDALLARAKALGGWYSRPWQGTPGGFAFKIEAKAREFIGADAPTPAPDAPAPGPDAPKASRNAPAAPAAARANAGAALAQKLRAWADGLDAPIANSRADRRMNTPKQQKQAADARQEGYNLERAQLAMRLLADMHEAGTVPEDLAGARTKAAIVEATRERLDHSRGGYYTPGRPMGEPAQPGELAKALWALTSGKADPEAAKAAEMAGRIAALRFSGIPGYFPTPAAVVAQMIAAANLQPGQRVLEPSAGSGAIADAVKAMGCEVDCIEHHLTLAGILRDKGHSVGAVDFIESGAPAGPYDAVLMNPPFEKGQDIEHVRAAFACVKPGGVLVAIMSAAVEFRSDKRTAAFREFVDLHGGELIRLPDGAFKESGTGVATVMLTLHR